MTTNERLFTAGLLESFQSAIDKGDKKVAMGTLGQVGLADQASTIASAIFNDPERYGYPRSG